MIYGIGIPLWKVYELAIECALHPELGYSVNTSVRLPIGIPDGVK